MIFVWRVWVFVLLSVVVGRAWGLDPHRPLAAFGRQVWTTENGLPQNTVRAVAQTPDGFLWLGTEDGLARFDGVEFQVYTPETTPEPVRAMAAQAEEARQRPSGVTAELRTREGRVWVGTVAGLAIVEPTSQHRGFGIGHPILWPEGMGAVRVLFEDREGAVWAGCDGGVARVVEGRVEGLRLGSAVLAMVEDREGSLWLGTEADGLMQLHEQRFASFGAEQGVRGSVARAVLEDARGTVWVGTDGGGLSRRVGERFEAVPGLSSGVVLALAGAANGEVWVGTPTGLNRVRDGKVRVFTASDGLADDYVRSVLVDRRGAVWVGTRHGLTRMDGSGAMTTFTVMDGLGSDFVGAMLEARNGELWVGTAGGLTRFDGKRFVGPGVEGAVTAMVEAADGTIWLGSNGGGLSRMRGGVVAPVRAGNLPAVVLSVLEDGRGRLWIGSRRGVVRVAESNLDAAIARGGGDVPLDTYDTADGMGSRECSAGGHPAAMRGRDGRLWFATLRGVTVVDPERLHENTVPPPVAIERVLVNDREVEPTLRGEAAKDGAPEVTVPAGQRRVEFAYAGLSFVAPGKVRYKYRLEGFDKDWVEAGARRTAFYTNLRPGRYVFHVAAANNDGVWSEREATVRLRLRPFFWETVWFYLLLVTVAGVAAYLAYAARVRRVEARYSGVMEERGRIAREIHDGLAQGIVSISLQLEVVGRLMGTSVEAAKLQLEAAKGMVRESLAEARSSIWELRAGPAPGEVEELPVRLGRSVKALTAPASVAGRLTVTGSYRAMARPVEGELLRIAQEAVTNAVRHAGGAAVEVVLGYDLKWVRLEVRDDGRGFDADAGVPEGHFGLIGMRERAEKIGARLAVRSEAGAGTRIVVELPLL